MKLSLLCICLFLCLSGCTHAFANEEVDYDTLVEHCRLDQVNEISLALSKDLNELSDQLQVISDTKDQLKKQLNQIRLQKEIVDKEYDEIRTQGSICLMRLQTRYPFSYDTLIDAYTEYAYDKEFINELKEQTVQKSKIETEYTKISHQYEKLHISCTKLQDQIDHLFSLQDRLFARFSSQIQEFKDSGEYNVHKIIQGNEQLPAYGAIHLEEYETNESCLVAGNYSIDSYSLNWSSVIENGTISAGTWTYPDGGMHLGLDIAASMFSEVKAPANGIILYADAPVDSDNGYLQNWCGWPAGGGNTICMICAVDEKLYGVSFAHHVFSQGPHGLSLATASWAQGIFGELYTLDPFKYTIDAIKAGTSNVDVSKEKLADLEREFPNHMPGNPCSREPNAEVSIWPCLADAWLRTQWSL